MNFLKSIMKKTTRKQMIIFAIVLFSFVASIVFVHHNYALYERPIAKVTEETLESKEEVTDRHQNQDTLYVQELKAEMKNGKYKGETVFLKNKYSSSGAYDQAYQKGDELFVVLKSSESGQLTGSVQDVKRDTYMMYVLWIFIFVLLWIGKIQGFFSIVSLVINAMVLAYALDVYVAHPNVSLLLIC